MGSCMNKSAVINEAKTRIEKYTPYRFPKPDLPPEPPKKDVIHNDTIAENAVPHFKDKPEQEYEKTIAKVQQQQEVLVLFEDDKFLPIKSSLSKDATFMSKKDITWKRPHQFMQKDQIKLFDNIEPMDIKQGELGDCYLLSSIAALAEQSKQIERLFITKSYQENGCYGLVMCIDGQMKQIVVDDQFPCLTQGGPVFSKTNGSELWVLLIEKAYAKIFGSYHKIESGLSGNAMKDLTGAPCEYFIRKAESEAEAKRCWDFIDKYNKKEYIQTASSEQDAGGMEFQKNNGIVSSHCYAILDAKEVIDSQGKPDKIYQIRNPWGRKEWEGNWSDQSDKWTPELRQQLNQVVKDDGLFWISYMDFINEFSQVCVCKLNPNYCFTSVTVSEQQEQLTTRVIIMRVYEKSHCFISLSQKDKKHFELNHKYSLARIIIGKIEPTTNMATTYSGAKMDNERDLVVEGVLEAGDYAVYIEVDWNDGQNYDRYLSLQSYSQNAVQFSEQQFSPQDITQILDGLIRLHEVFTEEEKVKDYGKNIKRISGNVAGYLYYTYINKNAKDTLKEEVTFKNKKAIEICPPYPQGDKFEVEVKPNDIVFVKLRVTKEQGGMFGFSVAVQSLFIEIFTDDQLSKICVENPSKRAQRDLGNGPIDVHVNSFTYSSGVAFLYINQTNQTFREEISFQLNNLSTDNYSPDRPIIVNVPPQKAQLISLRVIDNSKPFSYKMQSQSSLV